MRHLIPALAIAAGLAACKSTPPSTTPAPAPMNTPTVSAGVDSSAILAHRRDSLAQVAEAQRLARAAEARTRALQAAKDTLFMQVHFEVDRWDLRPQDRDLLDRKLAILRVNPGVALRIAGHCDERGSDEYNLALGARRAATVRTYLVTHGISDARLQAISYGEERPMISESSEWAWAQNRRGEFELLTAPENLQTP